MLKINPLKRAALGFLLLFLTQPALLSSSTFKQFTKFFVASQQQFIGKLKNSLSSSSQFRSTVGIYHDIEDDLEWILNVDSLEELTSKLTVCANGLQLQQGTITNVPLINNSCSFSFEFPVKALLSLLKKEKMQLLVQTYEDTINSYLENNTNSYLRKVCQTFPFLLKMLTVKINFTYVMSQQNLQKEFLSLLAIIVRKRDEIIDATQDKIIEKMSSTHYHPIRTIEININL